ncbi:MAG: flagellar hook-basal body complex protein [Planctomycetota bacterium]|jgi:flagellar hook protein FlgE|nr:flagellar hook-basal body complex protein [Planctomycetota bacterium]
MNSAISGLQAQQTKLDSIGDNLANVNTIAFKQTRVQFETLLSQTLTRGQAPQGTLGGIDPKQIGLGTNVAKAQHIFSQGNLKGTGLVTDMAIEGDGFFIFNDENGNEVYSRDGSLSLNPEQKFHNASNGYVIQGTVDTTDFNPLTPNSGNVSDITLPIGTLTIAKETTAATFQGNLNGGGDIADEGSVLESEVLQDNITGTPAVSTLNTLLTNLGKDNGSGSFIDFGLVTGDILTIEGKKGGVSISSQTFEIGQPPPVGGTTLQDLVEFIEGFLAIHKGNTEGDEQHSAMVRDTAGSTLADTLDTTAGDSVTRVGTTVTMVDANIDFSTENVDVGDFIRFNTGDAAGTVGRILSVAVGSNNEITFEHEAANSLPDTGSTWYIHEPAGVRLNSAAGVDANFETDKSGTTASNSVIRVSSNVGAFNAIDPTSLTIKKSDGTSLFGFNQSIAATGESSYNAFSVFNTLGDPHTVEMRFALIGKSNSGNTYRFWAESDRNDPGVGVDVDRRLSQSGSGSGSGTISFSTAGQFSAQTNNSLVLSRQSTGADPTIDFSVSFSDVTGLASDLDGNGNSTNNSSVELSSQDGYAQGTLDDVSIASDGLVQGTFTNGLTKSIARIAMGNFKNNNGLIDIGDNFFKVGVNSGTVSIGEGGEFGRGNIRQGFLEESNVELSEQFTDLIVAQRAFQANSRTISVTNELLRDLVNIV